MSRISDGKTSTPKGTSKRKRREAALEDLVRVKNYLLEYGAGCRIPCSTICSDLKMETNHLMIILQLLNQAGIVSRSMRVRGKADRYILTRAETQRSPIEWVDFIPQRGNPSQYDYGQFSIRFKRIGNQRVELTYTKGSVSLSWVSRLKKISKRSVLKNFRENRVSICMSAFEGQNGEV